MHSETIEIERKFLVRGRQWRADVERSEPMEQGYLAQSEASGAAFPGCQVRVRRSGDSGELNIKSREAGPSRREFEFVIDAGQATALLSAFCPGRIVKTRHHLTFAREHWIVDEFAGENAGLVVAEIELDAVDQSIELPAWAGPEVTHEPRFYNAALVTFPFATWLDRDYWLEILEAC